jgi:hypothetical protein
MSFGIIDNIVSTLAIILEPTLNNVLANSRASLIPSLL